MQLPSALIPLLSSSAGVCQRCLQSHQSRLSAEHWDTSEIRRRGVQTEMNSSDKLKVFAVSRRVRVFWQGFLLPLMSFWLLWLIFTSVVTSKGLWSVECKCAFVSFLWHLLLNVLFIGGESRQTPTDRNWRCEIGHIPVPHRHAWTYLKCCFGSELPELTFFPLYGVYTKSGKEEKHVILKWKIVLFFFFFWFVYFQRSVSC